MGQQEPKSLCHEIPRPSREKVTLCGQVLDIKNVILIMSWLRKPNLCAFKTTQEPGWTFKNFEDISCK